MSQEEAPQEKTIENHIENDKVEIELAYKEGNESKAHHLEDQLASQKGITKHIQKIIMIHQTLNCTVKIGPKQLNVKCMTAKPKSTFVL